MGVVLFWLLIWQISAMMIGQELFLACPSTVVKTLFSLVPQPDFWQSILFSFWRIVCGFLLALFTGTLMAGLAARFDLIACLLALPVSVIKSTPVASFVILALLWFGSKNLSIIIAFLMVFPVIYGNIYQGIRSVGKDMREMACVFHVSFGKQLRFIYMPAVMPFLISACKVGLGLCWKSGVAAEVIGIPSGSIGERLYQAKIFLNSGELFAWTIVIILISVGFEQLFLKILKFGMQHVLKGPRL